MSPSWLLYGAAAVAAFFASGDRWIPPRGWGRSPFGADSRQHDAHAVSVMMVSAPSGLSLAARIVPAATQPRGLAVILHGLCLNGSYYLGLAASLASSGVTVALLDLHGHGLSEGRRGAMPLRTVIDADLAHAIAEITKQHPSTPLLLIGHSAGAELLVSHEVISRLEATGITVAGACGLAPYFAGRSTQKPFDIRQPLFSINPRGFFSRRWPAVRYNLPCTWSDPSIQATFDRSLFKLSASKVDPAERLKELHKPVLLLVGENDAIISPAAVDALQSAQVLANRIPLADHMSIIANAATAILETLIPPRSHAETR